jgi:UDP-3-O-[3-hydroxymyristoyl] glucosamine N-acyltransferase
MAMTLGQLARRIGATLVGDGAVEITGCAPIEHAGPGEVTFVARAKYARFLESTEAAAVIVGPDQPCPPGPAYLVVDDPYFGFRNAVVELHGFRRPPDPIGEVRNGVSSRASVHPEATIGAGSVIHPHAVVEKGALLGRDCMLYPGAYVGPDVRLGDECLLYPHAVVYDRCVLGSRVTLHANTVVGHDGFGYATHDGAHHKIPQAGIVVIEDDVELGAGCAVERAAVGETRIGRGTKLADLISIGHAARIGEHCLLVSLVGVSGSSDIGNYVVLGGQTGVTGHLKVGDGVQAAGKTAIVRDLPPGAKVAGVPAVELDQWRRNVTVAADLYGLLQRIKTLEREVEQLRRDAGPA